MSGRNGPERRGPERAGPDYPPKWDNEPEETAVDGQDETQQDDERAALGVWLRTNFFWGINHGRELEAADALLTSEPMRRLLAARPSADTETLRRMTEQRDNWETEAEKRLEALIAVRAERERLRRKVEALIEMGDRMHGAVSTSYLRAALDGDR